jgi:hypothetical protein
VSSWAKPIIFASACPHCEYERVQNGFTVGDLTRLLCGGYPIEAYCAICDRCWSISLQQRVELGEVVATPCQGTALFDFVKRQNAKMTI